MKKVKRLTAVILSALMMTSAFSALPVSAATIESDTSVVSADETFKSGDYEYSLLNGGTVNITNYVGIYSDVTIPAEIDGKKVTSIGEYAFRDCTSLTSITIPDGVTSIGYGAFEGCSNLTRISIPDSVTSIGESAFSYCWSLTSISIPDSVTSIGYCAFYWCTRLTSINIPDGVTSIGDSAFSYCKSLTSINIPNSVTSIGDGTFFDCSSLTSISIPDGVTSIGDDAFRGCRSLSSINIPDSVTSIGWDAFDGCSSLTKTNYTGTIDKWTEIYFGNGYSNPTNYSRNLYINNQLVTKANLTTATKISNHAFEGCTSLTSISIPDGVTSIGDGAFFGCSSLTKTNYTGTIDKWTEIYFGSPFSNPTCYSRNLYINNQLVTKANLTTATKISNYAFSGCTSLTSINIPDSVTNIGGGAFIGCSNLTSINIPDSITSIGNGTFDGCSSLTGINIPNSVTSIGDNAFGGCSSLTSINIPDGVTSIGDHAFSCCSSLTSINIPDGVTSIGEHAFYRCSSLTSINIPDGVTGIGECAFSSCNNLSDVFYSNSDTEWSNISICYGNDNLASANIHYNTSSDDYFETSRTEANCTTDGVIEYKCPHGYTKTGKIPAYGHNLINGICSRCGKNELECFESAHPYEDNCDESWTINKPGAKSVSITFSSQTEVEDGYDYIEIYDGKDNLIGTYTGTTLASQCITVTGDTVRIRLISDSSNSCYGFSIDSIVAEPNALSLGDVNGDGEITILDSTCIQKYIVQLEDFTDKQKEVADVNGDGTIDIMDSTQIQKYIVQLIDTLG